MSRNLHLQVAKAWRIRRGERNLWVDFSIDTSAFTAAMSVTATSFAAAGHALSRYARAEELHSELLALGVDLETQEALLRLAKAGVPARQIDLIAPLASALDTHKEHA